MQCPVCNKPMIKRSGPRKEFYGCSMYPITGCTGKRDLSGSVWGCYDEEPWHLDDEGSRMFRACLSDRDMDYEEAEAIATEWQRLEEKDNW